MGRLLPPKLCLSNSLMLSATEKDEKKWPWLKVVSRNPIKNPSHNKKTANSITRSRDYPRKSQIL